MSIADLKGRTIAILATDGFEQSELLKPRKLLQEAGARVDVISPGDKDEIRGWNHADWGESIKVDKHLGEANAGDYDALALPGGVMNPDKLRLEDAAIAFVKAFFNAGKPVAAICHGPWLLVETGELKGRKVTSWPSIASDLRNAGAEWRDEQVVRDGQLITSRKPDDIPAFTEALAELLAGRQARAA